MVHQVVRESGYEGVLSSGIVLTGGRPSCRAWSKWRKTFSSSRRAWARPDRGQLADVVRSPRYATVLGLLLEAKKQYLRGHIVASGWIG
jgi:cell division protein FtsA